MATELQPRELATTMKAVRMHAYGGPDVLVYEDAPRPAISTGEALIRVHAAGVNPLDWKIREGYMKGLNKLPLVPGWDVSGVVEDVGAGVDDVSKGDAVYGLLDFSRDGAYAEYVAARSSILAQKPQSLDYVHAAAVPLDALVAWQSMFDVAGLSEGQTVLIHGAAGGVGHFTVQLAKWKGAKVIGTASAKNADFLRELGADETIDYHKTRFEDVARDVDVVLDTVGGDTQQRSWQVLKKGGMLISTVGIASPENAARYGVRSVSLQVRPNGEELRHIAALIDAGRMRPVINAVMPLKDAARAQKLSQTGHVRGKIVLKVSD
jgi:NADPH:quinone reductase-like Zn-dependent oxidoreductase